MMQASIVSLEDVCIFHHEIKCRRARPIDIIIVELLAVTRLR